MNRHLLTFYKCCLLLACAFMTIDNCEIIIAKLKKKIGADCDEVFIYPMMMMMMMMMVNKRERESKMEDGEEVVRLRNMPKRCEVF